MQFSKTFKSLCRDKGVTQKQALADMGLGRNAAQKWTEGNPSYEAMQKIACYFGVSMDSLLSEDVGHMITASGRSVVLHGNTGNNTVAQGDISTGGGQLSDMELELLRVFRSLDMRKRNALLSAAYDMEDAMRKEK